ncbi:MAG: CapA family protein [Candidatus Saccharibacteria bacterium]|nr:CapA family protein [Candidatus Saccharibacteria bacterium]
MRGMGKKLGGILFLVCLGASVAVGTCLLLLQTNRKENGEVSTSIAKQELKKDPVPDPVAIEAKMKIMYAGTTFWGRRTNQLARASKLGVKYPFSKISTLRREDYDAWIGGLECPLVQKDGNAHNYSEEYSIFKFNCDPDYLVEAKKYFTAFLLGNNHTDNQNGGTGLTETRKHLSDAGIQYFGTPKYTSMAESELTRDTKEATNCGIVVLPMNVTYDNGKTSKVQMPFGFCSAHGVFGIPGQDYIDNMKTYATYVPTIAMPHMGAEYQPSHDQLRQNLYRQMIDMGVDAVIADHPHWVQDAEAYKNKLIVYSMGNFMFDQYEGVEYSRSAAIEANAKVKTENVDFAKWNKIGENCLKNTKTCFDNIKNAKLPKISVTWKYDFHATTSASDCITRLSSQSEQNSVAQRLRWSAIPATMKVSK